MNTKQIKEQFTAFQRSRILLTAFELKIFTILGTGAETSDDVAAKICADPRATDRILNSLCAIGFVLKENGKFSNTDFSEKYLVEGKPEFISGLKHTVHLWDSWSGLTESIKKGGAVHRSGVVDRGDEWVEAFIEAMNNRAVETAGPSVERIDLSNVNRVLDIGGGSAIFSKAFVRAKKGLTATVFDLPNVVRITSKYIEKEGFSGQIDVHAGDYANDELPSGYDLVFLSAIVHSNSYNENEKLIKKCAEALNPDGQVVVQDYIMDEDRTKPERGAIFALNMITGTLKGDTYTESEIAKWMKNAGLSNIKKIKLPFGTDQMIGIKE